MSGALVPGLLLPALRGPGLRADREVRGPTDATENLAPVPSQAGPTLEIEEGPDQGLLQDWGCRYLGRAPRIAETSLLARDPKLVHGYRLGFTLRTMPRFLTVLKAMSVASMTMR